jgi:hypothetical protein
MTDVLKDAQEELSRLITLKSALADLDVHDIDVRLLHHALDPKINNLKTYIQKLQGQQFSHYCSFCKSGIVGTAKHIENLIICENCSTLMANMMTTSAAEAKWGLSTGTIRRDCSGSPAVLHPYMEAGLIQKSGSQWILHEKVMELYYGNPDRYKRRQSRNQENHE